MGYRPIVVASSPFMWWALYQYRYHISGYRDSPCKDKTVFALQWHSYQENTVPLYWNGPLNIWIFVWKISTCFLYHFSTQKWYRSLKSILPIGHCEWHEWWYWPDDERGQSVSSHDIDRNCSNMAFLSRKYSAFILKRSPEYLNICVENIYVFFISILHTEMI